VRARRPFPVTPSTLRPAGLAEWRPEALRPVNIDTNVPETTEKRDKSSRLAPELESSLKRYGSYTELKRAALIIAAAQTDKRSVKKLREEFLKIDTDASGTINEAELCAALGVAELDARISVEITPSTRCRVGSMAFISPQTPTKEVFAKLDHDRSGEVHYHEFLAATLEAHELLNEEVLQDTFDRMDHDDSGVISRENLRSLLGSRASDELVETLMQEGDLKRNGHVDYEEFSRVMRSGVSGSVDSLEDVAPMF
jgi:calcium-dependent protein kinase